MLIDESNVVHAIEKLKSNRAAARTAAQTVAVGSRAPEPRNAAEPQSAAEPRGVAGLQSVAQPQVAGQEAESARAAAPLRVVAPEPATVGRARTLGMPEWLAGQLAGGGLVRGAVTAMADCPAAVVDILAHVTANGGCAAVVGYPKLALAAIAAAGGELSRLIIVPDPAPHVGAVLSTLAEGLDLVVYVPVQRVTPTFARPVEARLRKSSCALLSCGVPWPGARLNLDVQVAGVHGLGRGSGRIRSIGVTGRVWGKGQPPQRITAELTGRRDGAGSQADRGRIEVAL